MAVEWDQWKRGLCEDAGIAADTARRGIRKENLAWTKSQTSNPGSERQTGSVAPGGEPPQYLGRDSPRRVLEIRRAQKNRRRKKGIVCAEGKQFFPAAGKRQSDRVRLA